MKQSHITSTPTNRRRVVAVIFVLISAAACVASPPPLSTNYSNAFFAHNYESQHWNSTGHAPDPGGGVDDVIADQRDEAADRGHDDVLATERREPSGSGLDDVIATERREPSGSGPDDVIGAERHRDDAMSARAPSRGPDELHARHNVPSAALDRILEAETDRDDSLTDIGSRRARTGLTAHALVRDTAALVRNTTARDYVELVPARYNTSHNLTQHELHDDSAPDTRFSDLQTLVFAALITLFPLLVVLIFVLIARWLLRRFCRIPTESVTSSVRTDSSGKHDDYKPMCSPTHRGDGADPPGASSPPSSGSVITMTLKNNHLIVETEERNDITRNGRETKMKYSPESDGIFVVEVQQSSAYRQAPPSPPQRALVHASPCPAGAGLSTSQLSIRSSDLPSYAYSAQESYEHGPRGYPPHDVLDPSEFPRDGSREPLLLSTPTDPDRPVVTAAILKQDSVTYCMEGSSDGPLLSDVQAREVSLNRLQGLQRADTVPQEGAEEEVQVQRAKRPSLPAIVPDLVLTLDDGETVTEELVKVEEGSGGPPLIAITEEPSLPPSPPNGENLHGDS